VGWDGDGYSTLAPVDDRMAESSADTDASETTGRAPDHEPADSVVVSYPADLSDWGRGQVETSRFRAYLRRVHDTVAVGEEWPEFVGVGCCGDSLDVPLRVERVDGGSRLTEDTAIEFAVREACDLDGGWQVQSAAGPGDGDRD